MLSDALEESLGIRVDVVTEASLCPTCGVAFSMGRLRFEAAEPMDMAEAKAKLDAALDELAGQLRTRNLMRYDDAHDSHHG